MSHDDRANFCFLFDRPRCQHDARRPFRKSSRTSSSTTNLPALSCRVRHRVGGPSRIVRSASVLHRALDVTHHRHRVRRPDANSARVFMVNTRAGGGNRFRRTEKYRVVDNGPRPIIILLLFRPAAATTTMTTTGKRQTGRENVRPRNIVSIYLYTYI